MIDLVGFVFRLSVPAAITWLSLSFPDLKISAQEIARHLETHAAIRQRTTDLWQSAAANLTSSRKWWGSKLLDQCGFPLEIPAERMLAGPGGAMGIAEARDVERCFSPTTMREEDRLGHRSNPSAHAVFRGRGWRDVLIFPFYDVPGRISGFQLVGRDGNSPHDYIFKVVARAFRGNQHVQGVQEAGLAMHAGAIAAARRYGNSLVAMDNAVLAAGLQMRQFERWWTPLPIVVWEDSIDHPTDRHRMRIRTHKAWAIASKCDIVHWMPHFRFAAILQAMPRGARIATLGPAPGSHESLRTYLERQAPDEFIRRVLREARPWQDVLGAHLSQLADDQVEELYRQLEAEGLDPEWVFSRCAPAGGARLHAALAKINPRTAYFARGTIIERDGAWFYKPYRGPETLLSDAIVRVDAITPVKRTGEYFVRGRILRANGEIPFFEPLARLDKNADRWLAATVHDHGGGGIRCHRRVASNLVQMAIRFQDPTIDLSYERLGWDEEGTQYILPGYVMPSFGPPKPVGNLPFLGKAERRALALPRSLQPADIEAVRSDCYSNRLFWATAAALIGNVLAPQWHLHPTGIALVGAGAQAVGRVMASAMGCATVIIRTARDVRLCRDEEAAHSWPLFVERSGRLSPSAREALWRGEVNGPRNLILSTDWGESRALLLREQWVVVEGLDPAQLTDSQRSFAEVLLPAYLRDLYDVHHRPGSDRWRRRLSHGIKLPWIEKVLQDLREFAVRIANVDIESTRRARKHIVGPDVERGLADLLTRAIESRRVVITDHPIPPASRKLAVIRRGPDRLFLPVQVLKNLVGQTGVEAPEWYAMRAALKRKNCDILENIYGVELSTNWLFARQKGRWLSKWGLAAA